MPAWLTMQSGAADQDGDFQPATFNMLPFASEWVGTLLTGVSCWLKNHMSPDICLEPARCCLEVYTATFSPAVERVEL